jgi:hypothetical protein
MASTAPLHGQLQQWLAHEACVEPRGDLAEAYIEAVGASAQRFPQHSVNSTLLLSLFRRLGARPDAWALDAPLRASDFPPADPTRGCPPLANLCAAIRLIELTAASLSPDDGTFALRTLLLLALDPRTPSTLVGPALAALTAALPAPATARALRTTLFQTSGDAAAHLRWRAVRAMPASPPAAHAWRRRFAMACALDDGRWLDASLPVAADGSVRLLPADDRFKEEEAEKWTARPVTGAAAQARVCLLLGEPEAAPRPFDCGVPRRRKGKRKADDDDGSGSGGSSGGADVDEAGASSAGRIDYAALAAALRTLDVAVDTGFTPHPTSYEDSEKDAAITSHDAAADAVAAAVEALRARVLSGLAGGGGGAAGPAHLARLAADAAASRLANRLRMAVRVGRPATRDWYDREGDSAVMRRWVGKGKGKARDDSDEDEDEDVDSGDGTSEEEDEDMDDFSP